MYGKLAAGLLTLGIALSTTMSAQAHAATKEAPQMECRRVIEPSSPDLLGADAVKTATSFQGGCNLGSRRSVAPSFSRSARRGRA